MVRTVRLAAAALVLSVTALGATGASAHGFGIGFGGFHSGFHLGGYGWGYRHIAFRPVLGGCFTKRWVNVYGDIVRQRVCY